MYLPLPQLASSDTFTWGDVRIHPEAIVAPGTILQALANNHITVGAGACISSGTILKASEGNIDIGEGAVLGMGVLIVGSATIGHHACIGAATTILQAEIPPHTAIAAATLLGDSTRQIATESQNGLGAAGVEPASAAAEEWPTAAEVRADAPETPGVETELNPPATGTAIVGQMYVNNLLLTLFPHRQQRRDPDKNSLE